MKRLLAVNEEAGVTTYFIADPDDPTGTSFYIEKVWDNEPFIETAKAMRNETHGQKYGNGRHVGFIPAAILGQMMRDGRINDPEAIRAFFVANPQYATFEKYALEATRIRSV